VKERIMKKLLSPLRLTLLLAILLSITSCWKDEVSFSAYPITGEIESFFEKVQNIHQSEVYNSAEGIEIVTEYGSIISIPELAFVDKNNNVVDGDVEIDYLEFDNQSAMLKYNSPSRLGLLSDTLIDSERTLFIEANLNGELLELRDNKSINIKIRVDDAESPLRFYKGDNYDTDVFWLNTGQDLPISNWEIYDSNEMALISVSGYEFNAQHMEWFQIGRDVDLDNFNEKTSVKVILPEELFSEQNTYVYIIFGNYNSILPLKSKDHSNQFESEFEIPVGESIQFIALSAHDDSDFSFDIKETYITRNHLEFMVPERHTLSFILDELSKF
jgi:hypothetical protein